MYVDQTDWPSIDTAPKDRVILTDMGTACYVDPRNWGSPVRRGWYLCDAGGDIPSCAEDGMAICTINPSRWMPMPARPKSKPPKTPGQPDIEIRTIYEAEIQWWWKDSHVHDTTYRVSVNDAARAELNRLCGLYDVFDDTRYTCQWEGLLISGKNLEQVTEAAGHLARYLKRFKHIKFI